MLTVWANPFTSSEMTNTDKFIKFKTNKNLVVKGVRTAFVVYNDPVFTSLNAKIYSEDAGPGELLYTSIDSRTKAEIHTLANGVKETYFTFNDIPLQSDTEYNLVINGSGYAPTDNSYLAWKAAFPDPIYSDPGFQYIFTTLNRCPFEMYLIAGEY